MIFFRFFMIIIGIVLVTIPLLLIALTFRVLKLKSAEKIPQLFHKILLKILGVRVLITGNLQQNIPLIAISNHISWLDILVIGASFPCYFVAKSEIAKWPIFGFLARLQNTIFVNRKAKGSEINKQVNEIADALKANKTIVLFPEGTTSDGNKILKFKSALFAAAQIDNNQYADIQPLCLNYKYSLGMPVHRQQRPFLAWYGDMELLPHVKSMIKYTPITVFIHIGEPISYKNFNSRQAIAEYLENFMRQAYIVN